MKLSFKHRFTQIILKEKIKGIGLFNYQFIHFINRSFTHDILVMKRVFVTCKC